MFRQSVFVVLSIVSVRMGCGMQCYQCEEGSLNSIARDETCKDPFGKTAHIQKCQETEICVKYKSSGTLNDKIGTQQVVGRYCGPENACEVRERQLKEYMRTQLHNLQLARESEEPQPQEQMLIVQELLTLKAQKTECYVCKTELCNSASAFHPSFIVSSLVFVVTCYFL